MYSFQYPKHRDHRLSIVRGSHVRSFPPLSSPATSSSPATKSLVELHLSIWPPALSMSGFATWGASLVSYQWIISATSLLLSCLIGHVTSVPISGVSSSLLPLAHQLSSRVSSPSLFATWLAFRVAPSLLLAFLPTSRVTPSLLLSTWLALLLNFFLIFNFEQQKQTNRTQQKYKRKKLGYCSRHQTNREI